MLFCNVVVFKILVLVLRMYFFFMLNVECCWGGDLCCIGGGGGGCMLGIFLCGMFFCVGWDLVLNLVGYRWYGNEEIWCFEVVVDFVDVIILFRDVCWMFVWFVCSIVEIFLFIVFVFGILKYYKLVIIVLFGDCV